MNGKVLNQLNNGGEIHLKIKPKSHSNQMNGIMLILLKI
jgi:hypothetical protein